MTAIQPTGDHQGRKSPEVQQAVEVYDMPRPIDPEREREEARIEGERAWRSAMFDAELRGQEDPFKPEVISTIHELEFILKRTKSSVEWLMKMPLAKLWEISDDLEAEAFPE